MVLGREGDDIVEETTRRRDAISKELLTSDSVYVSGATNFTHPVLVSPVASS
jgi:hypothetical protein